MNDDTFNVSFDDGPLAAAGDPPAGGASADELAAAKAKAEENYNKFLYAMAERQLADISLAGKKSVLKKILPVLDNLERALTYDPGSEGLRGGLQATLRSFESVLESEGVKGVSLKGARFDPKLAEAIGTQPPPAGVADDTVLEEAARAYVIGEDVLRVGQVIVAKTP